MPVGLLDRLKSPAVRKLSPEQYRILLTELSEAYKSNELTGSLARALSKDRAAKLNTAYAGDDNIFKKITRWATDGATTASLATVDPITASVNIGKRLGDARWVHDYVPLGAETQGAIGKFLVTDPVKKAFNKGIQGEKYIKSSLPDFVKDVKDVHECFGTGGATVVGARHVGDLWDANVLSPFTNQLKHLGNSTGYAFKKAGITKEQLDYMLKSYKNFTGNQDRTISGFLQAPARIKPIEKPRPKFGPVGNLIDKTASYYY